MGIDDTFLTLLTPDGQFLRARKQNQTYIIGDEIHFFPIDCISTNKSFYSLRNIFKQRTILAAALTLIIVVGCSFIPSYQNNKAYAYMTINADPSIELGINKKMQVVELTSFNKKGNNVISQIDDWEKKNVTELTNTILAEMKNEGYLNENEPITINTVPPKELGKDDGENLKETIKDIKTTVSNQHHDVTTVTRTEKEREKAHKNAGEYPAAPTKKAKEKQKSNAKLPENNGNNIPSQPSETKPNGQIKKQVENGTLKNKDKLEHNPLQENKNNYSNGNSNPYGQWKKSEEAKIKQNQGNTKKQPFQKENSSPNRKNNNEKKHDNAKVNQDGNKERKLNGMIK